MTRELRLSLLALRFGVAAVLGFLSVHALLARKSLAIAGLELLGAIVLLFHARAGAAILGASLCAAAVFHREVPIDFIIPALSLLVIAAARPEPR